MSISPQAALERTSAAFPPETPGHLRRNFTLGVVSGIAYNLYTAVVGTELVMTWFLSELTNSNLLISLLLPIELGSWFFLQLLFSGYVQGRPRTLPLYRAMGAARLAALAVLFWAAFALEESTALLIVFFAAFTVNSVAAGVAGLPFLNVVAKTVPPTRRGMYFAWRRFAGGLLGLCGGALVVIVLSPDFPLAFPDNYALLFLLGFLITTVVVIPFSLIVEPAEDVISQRVNLGDQLRRAARLATRDHNYGRYLHLRVAIAAANFALPFYAVYARRMLSAPEGMVGIYLMGSTLVSVLSNLVLGQLADRRGNRLLVRLAALTILLPPATALIIVSLPDWGLDKSAIFTLVFMFQGLHVTASGIGSSNYLLELASSVDRVLYVGFAHGVVGLALFASPLGGAIADWLGYEELFFFSLVCGLIAVVSALRLEEPRKKNGNMK